MIITDIKSRPSNVGRECTVYFTMNLLICHYAKLKYYIFKRYRKKKKKRGRMLFQTLNTQTSGTNIIFYNITSYSFVLSTAFIMKQKRDLDANANTAKMLVKIAISKKVIMLGNGKRNVVGRRGFWFFKWKLPGTWYLFAVKSKNDAKTRSPYVTWNKASKNNSCSKE